VLPAPTDVTDLNGTDPLAYIISANVHRRHMTRAQRAMALAMMAPEAEKGGRGKTSKIFEVFEGKERSAMQKAVEKARFVLKHKPLLAPEVLSGMLPLDNAFKQALAILYPEPAKGGRGKKSPLNGEFAQQYLSRARAVLKHSERLACDIRLRAERRAGALLREMDLKAGRPENGSGGRLLPIGISKDQSSQWQKLAAVPKPDLTRGVQAGWRAGVGRDAL
jgi:hypothetical protein